MVDIHSHILPGIDDGSPSWEVSLEMCRRAAADGVTIMAATPHMLDGVYNFDRPRALALVAELNQRLQAAGIALRVVPGGDVRVCPEMLEQVLQKQVCTLGDTGRYLLVEFPHDLMPTGSLEQMFALRVKGIQPIFSHPERNYAIQQRPEILREWVDMEVLLQVTAGSFTGAFGRVAEKLAWEMAKQGMAHIVASDAHDLERRAPGMSAARELLSECLSEEELKAAFELRPRYIIEGRNVSVPPIRPAAPKPSIFRRWFPWQTSHKTR